MRIVFAVLLMLEGFSSGVRLTRFIPLLVVYSWVTIAVLFVRAGVGVLQFSSGWMLLDRRPFGFQLAQVSLVISAVLTTMELGLRLTPTSLFPSYRWPVIAAYWVYALTGVFLLRQKHPRGGTKVPPY